MELVVRGSNDYGHYLADGSGKNMRSLKLTTGQKITSASSLVISFLAIATVSALAHSGRTNASGCHNNSKTGSYHCHNSGTPTAPSSPSSPRRSTPTSSPSRTTAPRVSEPYPKSAKLIQSESACINAESVNVRRLPSLDSSVVQTLDKNQCIFALTQEFSVTSNSYRWRKVRLSDGREGYTVTQFLNLL
ncbi:hypothetical protein C1752_08489 [Acaryochloris thomasi RCC1774]|uniref:SH3b domain-containing protein n=1 Tax=Acaryochloris thomasi RCC1774 TaxID=1764569 RepID=A0A2W1JQ60_9CYAN|nr:hypothetical protein C1752_08489 [Acaryochloris thomasi RCC1774]